MAACREFTVPLSVRPDRVFNHMKSMITQQKGSLQGDASRGRFSVDIPIIGQVKGNYIIANKQAKIQITQKPFLLPCGAIEDFAKNNMPR